MVRRWLAAAPFAVLGAGYAVQVGLGYDSHAYWSAVQHLENLYAAPALSRDAFLYSPVFAQVVWPLGRLPWPAFAALWSGLALRRLRLAAAAPARPVVLARARRDRARGPHRQRLRPDGGGPGRSGPDAGRRGCSRLLTKVTPGLVAVGWLAGSRQWRALAGGVADRSVGGGGVRRRVTGLVDALGRLPARRDGRRCYCPRSPGSSSVRRSSASRWRCMPGCPVARGCSPWPSSSSARRSGVNTLTLLAAVPRLRQAGTGARAASRT